MSTRILLCSVAEESGSQPSIKISTVNYKPKPKTQGIFASITSLMGRSRARYISASEIA